MRLSNATVEQVTGKARKALPITVLQFGEGNFLRAFVDQMLDVANETANLDMGVCVVQPIAHGMIDRFREQDGLYTLLLRGVVNGETVTDKRVITVIREMIDPYQAPDALLNKAIDPAIRFVVSNTTEAGIVYTGADSLADRPAASFPGKVAQLLWARYQALGATKESALVFLPCELIDFNGDALKDCVLRYAKLWALPGDFVRWVQEENVFANTLVDRIVPGYPRDEAAELMAEWGYEDQLIDTAEPFGLWVIEGPAWLKDALPLDKAGLPVLFTEDVKPFKLRKVRMLNGAHTSMVAAAYLSGLSTVGQCMADPLIRAFMTGALTEEIMPTIQLPKEDLEAFASAILERFANPFNPHYLLSIALNSVSKWRARVLPTILAQVEMGHALPWRLVFSFAALAALYRGKQVAEDRLEGMRGDAPYTIQDDREVIAYFTEQTVRAEDIPALCAREDFWGVNLGEIPGFAAMAGEMLACIDQNGVRQAIEYFAK